MGYKKFKRNNRWYYRDDPDEKSIRYSDKYDGGKSYEYLQYWVRHKSCPVECKRTFGHTIHAGGQSKHTRMITPGFTHRTKSFSRHRRMAH